MTLVILGCRTSASNLQRLTCKYDETSHSTVFCGLQTYSSFNNALEAFCTCICATSVLCSCLCHHG